MIILAEIIIHIYLDIVVENPQNQDKVAEIISTFDQNTNTFYQARNVIKIIDVGDEKWNIKSFKIPHIVNKLAYRYIRKSKAQRSFEFAKLLLKKGVLTPKPIAYAEQKLANGLNRSFYISENLEYDFTFRELINDKNFKNRKIILEQFAEFTFNLHELGIHFLDHSPGNTLIVEKDSNYEFYLIDLNRMKFGEMDFETRIKNFDRLSLTDEMIEIIVPKYAKLSKENPSLVIEKITAYCHKSAARREAKKNLKIKLGIKKKK